MLAAQEAKAAQAAQSRGDQAPRRVGCQVWPCPEQPGLADGCRAPLQQVQGQAQVLVALAQRAALIAAHVVRRRHFDHPARVAVGQR